MMIRTQVILFVVHPDGYTPAEVARQCQKSVDGDGNNVGSVVAYQYTLWCAPDAPKST